MASVNGQNGEQALSQTTAGRPCAHGNTPAPPLPADVGSRPNLCGKSTASAHRLFNPAHCCAAFEGAIRARETRGGLFDAHRDQAFRRRTAGGRGQRAQRAGLQPRHRRADGRRAARQHRRGRARPSPPRRRPCRPGPRTTPLRRARILNKFLRILEERTDELAAVITAEHGKVLSDAKGEIQRGMEVVEFATGAPQLLKGEVTENVGTRVDSHSLRQPLGRRRRHHAVQLSRPWCRCGCSRWRSPAATASSSSRPSATRPPRCSSPSGSRRPACRTACSTSCTATRRRSTRSCTIPDIAGVSFVGSTPIARYIYETAAHARASAARRSAAPRTT